MVAFADGEGPPPAELRLARWCERFQCLPSAGGLYEQEYRTVFLMSVLDGIHRAVSKLRNAHGADIHKLTDSERAALKILVDMGLLFNA